jgi:hypothetical protein
MRSNTMHSTPANQFHPTHAVHRLILAPPSTFHTLILILTDTVPCKKAAAIVLLLTEFAMLVDWESELTMGLVHSTKGPGFETGPFDLFFGREALSDGAGR